ncbi:MAG: 2'-deoxycytidine 5'-triphosphate deaminase [Desulfobacteraceae bacterium]|nr:2'-deoxycytidine 5'-triphosphate deaminase [Desulfobacteraceae bacterium]
MSAGILCENQINKLIEPEAGTIRLYKSSGRPFEKLPAGAASIDLPLSDTYWEMKGSCRTGNEYKVTDLTRKYSLHPNEPKSIESGSVVLIKRNVYLFKADCELDLSETSIQGKATARSSIGRLDVLVRLLVDGSDAFDFLDKNKKHDLYVEVTPISFDLEVKRGTTLSQLRLFKGKERDISLTKEELFHEEDSAFPVLDENGRPYRDPCLLQPDDIWFSFRLNLDPDPVTECSAFVAKKGDNLPPIDPDKEGHYDPHKYWEPIKAKDGAILLEPDRLYILRSKERLSIPSHLALECKSYTTQMGEWRIEYAGFAHPYFGSMRNDGKGAPIMFEVRGHNVPTILTHEIPLGNVRFLRMSQPAAEPDKKPTYEEQELTLSKCFKPWS